MDDLVTYLINIPSWDIEDVKNYLNIEIEKRKKILLFKKISPIVSEMIMKDKERSDMNKDEFEYFKNICENICGYPYEGLSAKLNIKNKADMELYLNKENINKIYKLKILEGLGLH